MVLQQTTREMGVELITHRSWRKCSARPEGPHREVKAEQEGEGGPGAQALVRVCG